MLYTGRVTYVEIGSNTAKTKCGHAGSIVDIAIGSSLKSVDGRSRPELCPVAVVPSAFCRKIGGEAYTKLVADWVVETVEWCEVKHEIGGNKGLDQTF